MRALLIEIEGQQLRIEEPRVVTLGRGADADVVVVAMSVSRAHAELRPLGDGWTLVDVGSSGGTYVDGDRIAEYPVEGTVTAYLGTPGHGGEVRIAVLEEAPAESVTDDYPTDALTLAPGELAPIEAGEQSPSGPDLLLTVEGHEYRYRHPARITVGRRSDCDIVVSDPSVSRRHGEVASAGDGWLYRNLSEDGSYVKGRKVEQYEFDSATEVRLGHPVAGELLGLVPILSAEEELRRFAARRRRRNLLIGIVVAASLVVIAAAVSLPVLLSGEEAGGSGDSMSTLTREEADTAKAATVFIAVPDGNDPGVIVGSGSGTILTEDGTILTNAHVADPGSVPARAEDGAVSPEYVIVSLTDPDDDFRASDQQMYRAKVVESDPDRDASVLEIYADGDGDDIDPDDLDLPTMPMGDSEDVHQGDGITVLGFPSIAGSEEDADELGDLLNQITQTGGTVATIVALGDNPRGVFDVTARIAPGNSGGAAVDNDGRLVGVPTRIKTDPSGSGVTSGRVAPLDYLASALEAAGVDVP